MELIIYMWDQSDKFFPFLGALATVTLTAIAQTCLKVGMSGIAEENITGGKTITQYSIAVFTNKFIFFGMLGYLLSTLLWLYVLSRLPLSTAYPFVGLSIVLTSIFGVSYLGEPNSTLKMLGVLLVFAGVVLVSRS
jgi:multidrug transporter EmrE-like cation transporter